MARTGQIEHRVVITNEGAEQQEQLDLRYGLMVREVAISAVVDELAQIQIEKDRMRNRRRLRSAVELVYSQLYRSGERWGDSYHWPLLEEMEAVIADGLGAKLDACPELSEEDQRRAKADLLEEIRKTGTFAKLLHAFNIPV